MPDSSPPLDQSTDRLFFLLSAGTLRSRERYLTQCAQAAWAQACSQAEQAAPAEVPPQASATDPAARLFDILAACTLRSRARFIAQSPSLS